MKLVHLYLNFPGTTEEALRFYAEIFGTKIEGMMTYGQVPFAGPVSDANKAKIMHAQLPLTSTVHLMASDCIEGIGKPLHVGNHFHVSIVGDDKAEADRLFTALSTGGAITMPIANAPWGPYFGMCVDRFGVQWMVSLPHPA